MSSSSILRRQQQQLVIRKNKPRIHPPGGHRGVCDSLTIDLELTTLEEEELIVATEKVKKQDNNKNSLEQGVSEESEEEEEEEDEEEGVLSQNMSTSTWQTGPSDILSKQKYDINDLASLPSNNSKFCKILVHLLTKNKISSKNAFDVKIPCLDELHKVDFSQHSAWKIVSSGLGAGAKIWGFKVDNTYGDTMKVIQKLFRIDAFDSDEIKVLATKQQSSQNQKKVKYFDLEAAIRNSDSAGAKTLEFNTPCLNADLYDLEFDKDPTFWRTSVNFDVKSAETMLLNKLPMDADFGYVVDCEEKITLRVDKRLEEISLQEESGLTSQNPSLLHFLQPFVIRRKPGMSTAIAAAVSISPYEVIADSVRYSSHQDRRGSEHQQSPLNIILTQGLCDELTHFTKYVQSERVFSESVQRWKYHNDQPKQNALHQQSDTFVKYQECVVTPVNLTDLPASENSKYDLEKFKLLQKDLKQSAKDESDRLLEEQDAISAPLLQISTEGFSTAAYVAAEENVQFTIEFDGGDTLILPEVFEAQEDRKQKYLLAHEAQQYISNTQVSSYSQPTATLPLFSCISAGCLENSSPLMSECPEIQDITDEETKHAPEQIIYKKSSSPHHIVSMKCQGVEIEQPEDQFQEEALATTEFTRREEERQIDWEKVEDAIGSHENEYSSQTTRLPINEDEENFQRQSIAGGLISVQQQRLQREAWSNLSIKRRQAKEKQSKVNSDMPTSTLKFTRRVKADQFENEKGKFNISDWDQSSRSYYSQLGHEVSILAGQGGEESAWRPLRDRSEQLPQQLNEENKGIKQEQTQNIQQNEIEGNGQILVKVLEETNNVLNREYSKQVIAVFFGDEESEQEVVEPKQEHLVEPSQPAAAAADVLAMVVAGLQEDQGISHQILAIKDIESENDSEDLEGLTVLSMKASIDKEGLQRLKFENLEERYEREHFKQFILGKNQAALAITPSLNLQRLERSNPFRDKLRDDQLDESVESILSEDEICEQFLGNSFREQKESRKKQEYLENYDRLFEEHFTRISNKRQQEAASVVQKERRGREIPKSEQQTKSKLSSKTHNALMAKSENLKVEDEANSELRRMEMEVEELFNKALNSDHEESGRASPLPFLLAPERLTDAYPNRTKLSSSSTDLLIDFRTPVVAQLPNPKADEIKQSEDDPSCLIKRALGDSFWQTREEVLSEKEMKGLNFTWGFFSVPKPQDHENQDCFLDEHQFNVKLFNIGKGTHRIDMRQSVKAQGAVLGDIFRGHFIGGEFQDEDDFQNQLLPQVPSFQALPRSKFDWEKRRDKKFREANRQIFQVHFFDGETITEEDYDIIVQPRYRSLESLQISQRRRYLRRNDARGLEYRLSDRQRFQRNLKKKREILELLCSKKISYGVLNALHVTTQEYMHFLELPSLTHFVATSSLQTLFRHGEEAVLEISFDQSLGPQDSLASPILLHFDNLPALTTTDEVDFDIYAIGLYEALEVQKLVPAKHNLSSNLPLLSTPQEQVQALPLESKPRILDIVINKEDTSSKGNCKQLQRQQQPSQKGEKDQKVKQQKQAAIIDLEVLMKTEEYRQSSFKKDTEKDQLQHKACEFPILVEGSDKETVEEGEQDYDQIYLEPESAECSIVDNFSLEEEQQSAREENFDDEFQLPHISNLKSEGRASSQNTTFRMRKLEFCQFRLQRQESISAPLLSPLSSSSRDSLEEQYNHCEFSYVSPIDVECWKMSRKPNEPLVKWEVKMEEVYEEIRAKSRITSQENITHLAPNIILLDRIRNADELASQPCFLEELNNMRRFRNYSYFKSPLETDYMGMANKIHMKELIIKIWFRIKKLIKSSKEIQVGEKPFSFFDLLLQIPDLIGEQNANSISQQTIFQVILHLANLKSLRLIQDQSNLNFYILSD